ncbi:MAG TPA: hypothetical protein VJU18_08625 [Vicinamibacteria bacterium]|nr:hypothetical protein [Vicinamibacteria bacterium]
MWRWILRLLAVPAVIAALWFVLGRLAAWRLEVRAERAWAKVREPMDAFERRFPKAPASLAAIKLNDMAGRLGIEMLAPRSPASPSALPVSKVLGTGMERKADDERQPPSKEATSFLAAHSSDIEAIIVHLRDGPAIEWEIDLGRHLAAPVPSLVAQRDLQSVLLARALDAGVDGDAAAVAAALEASWKLSEGTRTRPDLISALITYLTSQMQLGTLRQLEGVPELWQRRVVEDDPRDLFLRGLQTEALVFAGGMMHGLLPLLAEGDPQEAETAFTRYVDRPFSTPFLRLCGADHSTRVAAAVAELRGRACGTDVTALNGKALAAVPRWNFVSRIAMPNLLSGWRTAVSTALLAELTQQVLNARSLRASKGVGAWPEERATVASATCPASTWVRERAEDGSLTITLDKVPLEWDQATPPAFRLRAAAQEEPQRRPKRNAGRRRG